MRRTDDGPLVNVWEPKRIGAAGTKVGPTTPNEVTSCDTSVFVTWVDLAPAGSGEAETGSTEIGEGALTEVTAAGAGRVG